MEKHGDLLVETLTNGPFAENCFLVADAATKRAIVVDPGDEDQRILARIRELELEVTEIVATHAHVDHVGAVAPLKRLLGVPFAIHPAEADLLRHLPAQAQMFGLPPKEVADVDRELEHEQPLRVGELIGTVLGTPGHSPGGCSLYFADAGVVLVGDALFAGSIGRTDLPGGDLDTLLKAIREQLLSLDDGVVVYSGHGPATTVGQERRSNPFLQEGWS
jgi:glyoxylase-like metal-dependent hydrolase (beta-lactamase superfamily II)